MVKKVTTFSGAVYFVDLETGRITGGSKKLTSGALLCNPVIGQSMLIHTPERRYLHPEYRMPGVTTSYVVSIEEQFTGGTTPTYFSAQNKEEQDDG